MEELQHKAIESKAHKKSMKVGMKGVEELQKEID